MSDEAEFPAPALLSSTIVDSAAEAAEAVQAAGVLDLGIRVFNRLVPDTDADDDSLVEEWVVEVYTSTPAVDPDVEEE
ncbi:hypothetical protein [Umezawaea beigongshangensis]|uniref:hypothetical protein n=1 Tax=Umezawaea beigongshangensis TaxID=2780383 RepID=UPI0018F22EAB|nr:hypothetical protein [Umezawaea beigongshangensis]